jgi:hypothetical protein
MGMIQCWCGHGFFFVSGMVTYFWFGHLGLFWYGLEVVLVRSTFQINSKCALVWSFAIFPHFWFGQWTLPEPNDPTIENCAVSELV